MPRYRSLSNFEQSPYDADGRRPAGASAKQSLRLAHGLLQADPGVQKETARRRSGTAGLYGSWRATSGDSRWLFARCATVNKFIDQNAKELWKEAF